MIFGVLEPSWPWLNSYFNNNNNNLYLYVLKVRWIYKIFFSQKYPYKEFDFLLLRGICLFRSIILHSFFLLFSKTFHVFPLLSKKINFLSLYKICLFRYYLYSSLAFCSLTVYLFSMCLPFCGFSFFYYYDHCLVFGVIIESFSLFFSSSFIISPSSFCFIYLFIYLNTLAWSNLFNVIFLIFNLFIFIDFNYLWIFLNIE